MYGTHYKYKVKFNSESEALEILKFLRSNQFRDIPHFKYTVHSIYGKVCAISLYKTKEINTTTLTISVDEFKKIYEMEDKKIIEYRILCSFENEQEELLQFLLKKKYNCTTWLSNPIPCCCPGNIITLYSDKSISIYHNDYNKNNVLTVKEFIMLANMNKEEEKCIKITLSKAKELYPTASKEMKVMLESTFPELLDLNYPKTYSELQMLLFKGSKKAYDINWNLEVYEAKPEDPKKQIRSLILTKERAKEHLAFLQITTLMDYYNDVDKFKPDWNNLDQEKYFITCYKNEIMCGTVTTANTVLAFKSSNTRDLFLFNFKELIEKCKNLI